MAAVAAVESGEPVVGNVDGHVLTLGDEVFTCSGKLPVSTLIRYADNDLLGLHHVLVKLVDPADHDRMWDAFELLDADEVTDAITALLETYSDRPTARPTPSRGGPQSTRRK